MGDKFKKYIKVDVGTSIVFYDFKFSDITLNLVTTFLNLVTIQMTHDVTLCYHKNNNNNNEHSMESKPFKQENPGKRVAGSNLEKQTCVTIVRMDT